MVWCILFVLRPGIVAQVPYYRGSRMRLRPLSQIERRSIFYATSDPAASARRVCIGISELRMLSLINHDGSNLFAQCVCVLSHKCRRRSPCNNPINGSVKPSSSPTAVGPPTDQVSSSRARQDAAHLSSAVCPK